MELPIRPPNSSALSHKVNFITFFVIIQTKHILTWNKGVAQWSVDPEYLKDRETDSKKKAKNVGEGLVLGAQGLGKGFFHGVTGLLVLFPSSLPPLPSLPLFFLSSILTLFRQNQSRGQSKKDHKDLPKELPKELWGNVSFLNAFFVTFFY